MFKVNVPGMVDTFKTKYEGLQIPYPSDGGALKGEKLKVVVNND